MKSGVNTILQQRYLCSQMKRALKITGGVTAALIVLLLAVLGYVITVSTLEPPEVDMAIFDRVQVEQMSETDRRSGSNFLVRNVHDNWELFLQGGDFERGVIKGKLCEDLLYQQEKHFVDQIQELVPDAEYLNFLKYFVGFFNRNLNHHVTDEYRREIYGVSLSAPDTFDFISPAYDRMMNYHAAHDIGHALQNLAMVGCTSFATGEEHTADGSMLVGRNFDFFAGDGFAENKIVAFIRPDSGYAFLSVTWAGMMGVVSGMNTAGLTITLNAAPSEIPTSSATPISILAREILQYAETIDEAMQIANQRQTFVSESLLITSAKDGVAALIEKTPSATQLYQPNRYPLICSNHFQSDSLGASAINRKALDEPDSPYRFALMEHMLDSSEAMTPADAVRILRNRSGLPGDELGLGNPMAINQLIAHHGIVFQPEKRMVWVSSSPFQLGAFAAYDLNAIFGEQPPQAGESIAVDSLLIPEDDFLHSEEWLVFQEYRHWLQDMRVALRNKAFPFSVEEIERKIALNPDYYLGYQLAAEYFIENDQRTVAARLAKHALTLKIPYRDDREKLEDLLQTAEADAS